MSNSKNKNENVNKKLILLQSTISDGEKTYREIINSLKTYGATGQPNPITGMAN